MTAPADETLPHEREAKVSVWPGFELPDLDDLRRLGGATDPTEQVLDAGTSSTRTCACCAWASPFRHRTGEDDAEGRWTLKLPAASEGVLLDRLELEEPGPPGRLPSTWRRWSRA